jgi:hypothetical protein
MTLQTLAEDPFEILVRHILDGTLNATPEGIALVAWVCDFVATEPHFVALYDTGDGLLLGEHSDDVGANALLGSVAGFMDQLTRVCRDCGLTDAQTDKVLARARERMA